MKPCCRLSLLCVMLWCAPQAGATAIQQMGLSEVAGASELVFEGRVIAAEVRPGPDGRRIYTYVTLQVLDAIKGQAPGETVQLRFLGGTLGDLTLAVSDMHVPEIGEHGIYCVESLQRPQANPLYGWDQGHYIIRPDIADGQEKVYTRGQQAVTGFVAEASQRAASPFSRGYALGMSVRQDGASTRALTLEQFKQGLRDLLGRGR
jgi:hypothetical protein